MTRTKVAPSRVRQLMVAVVSSVLGRAVTLVAPLLVMAPLLKHLGPGLFGVWITAVAVSAMAAVLDFGIGNAALTRLSEAFGRDDPATVRRILGEAYALLGGISAVFATIVIIGSILAHSLMAESEVADEMVVIAIVLVALFASFPAQLITKLLQARHAFIQSQLAQIVGPLVALVACLAGISAGVDPVGVVALYALPNTFVLGLWSLGYFAAVPQHRPDFAGLDFNKMRHLIQLGGAFFIVLVFYVIGMNADNVVIALRVSGTVVAEYGVPTKLGSILIMIVGTVFLPLWPLYGDALARHDKAWLKATTRRMSFGGAAIVFAVGLALTLMADPIMLAWMGRPFVDQQLILLGWTMASTVIALTAPYNMVLNAAGLARPQILPWIAFVVISLGAKVLFLTAETVWWTPWITAAVYAVTITPRMIRIAHKEMTPNA